ncbi:MAG: S24 family peptidase [Oscillospiraceae bacterium]
MEIVKDNISRNADYALRITGNSLEPDYHNGDILLINSRTKILIDSIGVFSQKGKTYIKRIKKDYLVSLNPKIPKMPLNSFEPMVFQGTVIGKGKSI